MCLYFCVICFSHVRSTRNQPRRMSRKPFDLESPNFTWRSIPTCSTATPDMTALSTSGEKNCQKYCFRRLRVEFLENGLSTDHTKFYTLLEDNLPHKLARYDATSCFRSAFIEVRKTAENAASDDFVCIKANAVSKPSSNLSNVAYR